MDGVSAWYRKYLSSSSVFCEENRDPFVILG